MQGKNNNQYRPAFRGAPVNLSDPMIQHITMMALMSRPGIEKQLEEAINIIEGISNTIRTMRRGMESFHVSMREAQRHMQSFPSKQAYYGPPKQENNQPHPNNATNFNNNNQPQYNKFNTKPLDNTNNNTRDNSQL